MADETKTETTTTQSPTPPPAALGQSFDTAFPDDGLDTAPPPPAKETKEAAPDPTKQGATAESGDSQAGSKETAGSKDATAAAGSAQSTQSGSTAKDSSAQGADKKGDYNPPTVVKSSELKSWATRMGARAKKAEEELAGMQAKLAQLESRSEQISSVEAVTKELAEYKKRVETYENDLRLTKYERSQEYQTKFRQPYERAVAQAYGEVKELLVAEPNPANPEETRDRPATQADFDEIYNMPLGQATRVARQKFGDAAPIVLQHRQNIRQLAQAAYSAVEEYKTKGTEYENQTKAQQAQQEQAMQAMFHTAATGYAQHKSDMFLEKDGDEEGNGLLVKGREFAAAVFAGNDGLSPQQVVMRDAVAFNRLAAYPRLVRDVARLQAQLEEANKSIETLRGSGPGSSKQTTQAGAAAAAAASTSKSWKDDFDAAVPA